MTSTESRDFYRSLDSDHRPVLPEPEELIDIDWQHAGDME